MRKAWVKDHRPITAKCSSCERVTTGLGPKSRKNFQLGYCEHCRKSVIFKPYLTLVK